MSEIWVIGKQVTLPNGHKYMAPPFIVFESNKDAQEACDMVQKVSGERPMMQDAALYRHGDRAVSEIVKHNTGNAYDNAKRFP